MEQAVGKSHVASKEEITNTTKRSMSPPLYFGLSSDAILEFKELYISDIAAVVHLSDVENTGQEFECFIKLYDVSDGSRGSSDITYRIKRLLGNIMHILGDYLEQLGLKIPIYCLISVSSKNRLKFYELTMLASDQDWSRGEFAVIFALQKDAKKVISGIVLDLAYDQLGPSIEPISTDAFSNRIQEEASSRNLSADHQELVSVIIDCVAQKSPPKMRIETWVQGRLDDIKKKPDEVIL